MGVLDGLFDGLSLLGTCTVRVLRRRKVGSDEYNAPLWGAWEPEDVSGVIATPGATADLEASRPEGVTVAMTFHFPKGYGKPLKGCRILWGGREYRVVGDPQPYMAENVPGPVNMPVECEACDG